MMAYLSFKSKLRISWTTMAALVLLTGSSAAPVSGGIDTAISYLSQYGYLSPSLKNPSVGHMVDVNSMGHAIAEFQSFFGLNITGELDEETTKVMSLPRCGVPDKVYGPGRAKRYVLLSKWSKMELTYKISKYPSGSELSDTEVDAELARAFAVWSEYTDLTFTQKRYGYVDIEIRFEKGEHGDGDSFDGPSSGRSIANVLAHAFPPENGIVHFDDAEQWTIKSSRGINLFQVAVHEFGHALGLSHSNVKSAVMAPTYTNYDPSYRLHQDDIQGIQALYGSKTTGRYNGDGWDHYDGRHSGSTNDIFKDILEILNTRARADFFEFINTRSRAWRIEPSTCNRRKRRNVQTFIKVRINTLTSTMMTD